MYLLITREFKRTRVDFYVDEQNLNEFWVTQEQKGIRKTIVYNFDGLIKICTLSNRKDAARVVDFLWGVKHEFGQKDIISSLLPEKSELQLFNYGEKQVRLIKQGEEVWFVTKDVCNILELTNPTEAIKSLDDDEKMTLRITEGQKNLENMRFYGTEQSENLTFCEKKMTSKNFESLKKTENQDDNQFYGMSENRGGAQFYNMINEPGLYKLIFKSRKPEAKQFTRWVTHEVLPSVIHTGTYTIGAKPQKMLTGQATDTTFYSADELAAELGTNENSVMITVHDNNLDIYGFLNTDECLWYFTEEGRMKILEAFKNETWV